MTHATGDTSTLGEGIGWAPHPHDENAPPQLESALGDDWARLDPGAQSFLRGVAGCSPFLRRIMKRRPALTGDLLRTPPEDYLAGLLEEVKAAQAQDDQQSLRTMLRDARERAALAIALADIAKNDPGNALVAARAISDFADVAVETALVAACRKFNPERGTDGVASIAMGKLGARELNYSSDIDLIIIYDPGRMGVERRADAKERAVRIARELVSILQTQTGDGYVFRTDLRLRPDPGVSALAVSVDAAEAYYESFGQNWERMAFTKARAHAGDIAMGRKFLQALRPFVWRKYLDFAAIEDVKAVKRQMHSAKGGGVIEFAGHDIKTGRGGIREIEFFAQTQQLILGGKNEELRVSQTLHALQALHDAGHVTREQLEELYEDYLYLRHVEHRLQMINDEQTHRIPMAAGDIERLAFFLGDENSQHLEARMIATLTRVQGHFDELFRDDAAAFAQPGPLVFTGVENDPRTLETLAEMGFSRAGDISNIIREWHRGGIRATRTERARNILTGLMAPLLKALSRSGEPDAAFLTFNDFLRQLPSGVQIFSLLANNVALFDALIDIVGISPFLGREMSRRTNFIEALLETGLSGALPDRETYAAQASEALADAPDYEGALNAVRRWAGEEKFAVTARQAVGVISAPEAAKRFSTIADLSIEALYGAVMDEMEDQHGRLDGAFAVLGLGRLGAEEMTIASDIDIMFVYDAPEGAMSDGEKSLPASEYYTRLVRRYVTALSASTEEGELYEVDMALRPSGRAGPAAVSLAAFRRYYAEKAWTWEYMAMARARVIAGESALADTIAQEVRSILARPRNPADIATDVCDMRGRLAREKPARGAWDVKNMIGGLTDIGFVIQYLTLVSAADRGVPPRETDAALVFLAEHQVIGADDARTLREANGVFQSIIHTARMATGALFRPDSAGALLRARMAGILSASDLGAAEDALGEWGRRVAGVYKTVLGRHPTEGV